MPDSTRPKSSMFFKVAKSFLSFDNSLRRILNHQGGKNLNILFSYLTSRAFDNVLIKPYENGSVGKEIFLKSPDEWINSKQFLELCQLPVTSYNIKSIQILFNSFAQDKALKSKFIDADYFFQFQKDLEYPSDLQIEEVRNSNPYFMDAIDDMIEFLPQSLMNGNQMHDRNKIFYQPLWEALLADPLYSAFRDELVFLSEDYLPNSEDCKELNIIQIGSGMGLMAEQILTKLIDKYDDVVINYTCYEEISNLINKSEENVNHFLNSKKSIIKEKSMTINMKFQFQPFYSIMHVGNEHFDLIIGFQILHYIGKKKLVSFFEQMARLLKPHGMLLLSQFSSYSEKFPYPLSLFYLPVISFEEFPTKDQIIDSCKSFFNSSKVSGLDSMWILKDPVNYH